MSEKKGVSAEGILSQKGVTFPKKNQLTTYDTDGKSIVQNVPLPAFRPTLFEKSPEETGAHISPSVFIKA
jgi:hypothetical protein